MKGLRLWRKALLLCQAYQVKDFQQALELIEDLDFYPDDVADYNVSNVSDKVLRTIISYTDYINQNIWKKI